MKSLCSKNDLHLPRKFWHIGTGLIGLGLYKIFDISQLNMAIGVMILAGIAFLAEFVRLRNPRANAFVVKRMGLFMRSQELYDYSGFVHYAFGCALVLLLFQDSIAVLAILFLIFSDPMASYVGIRFGRKKIKADKSLQGTLAGGVICTLITIVYGLHLEAGGINLLLFSLCAGILGTSSELFSFSLNDNLTIPIFSGIGLFLLNQFFAIL